MTVSQLKAILESLETTGAGNYQIKFCCEEKHETNVYGTGAAVLPFRVFDFSDKNYEFKTSSYLTNNGMYPCKTTICTDNIDVNPADESVTFHQF
jgi:hypothetical protein